MQRRVTSGGFQGRDSEDANSQQPRTTKVVGMLSSTRSTDKRTMNILDLKQNTFTNTSNKFQGIFSTTLIRFPHIIGILHCDHCSRHVSHVFGVENLQLCQTFHENAEVSIPEKPSELPQVGQTRCLAPSRD